MTQDRSAPGSRPKLKEHAGKKYLRVIHDAHENKTCEVDVYAVIEAFNVTCPARQHALKKILCAGLRGKATTIKDLEEAIVCLHRAIDLEEARDRVANAIPGDFLGHPFDPRATGCGFTPQQPPTQGGSGLLPKPPRIMHYANSPYEYIGCQQKFPNDAAILAEGDATNQTEKVTCQKCLEYLDRKKAFQV